MGSNDEELMGVPDEKRSDDDELRQQATTLQLFVPRFSPVAWYPARGHATGSVTPGRLFLASGTMWLVSFLMKTVFVVVAV